MTTLNTGTDFAIWGNNRDFALPVRVTVDEFQTDSSAVAQAIARKNKLSVANCRHDVNRVDSYGNVTAQIYQVTLGKRMRSGGFSLRGELWFRVGSA